MDPSSRLEKEYKTYPSLSLSLYIYIFQKKRYFNCHPNNFFPPKGSHKTIKALCKNFEGWESRNDIRKTENVEMYDQPNKRTKMSQFLFFCIYLWYQKNWPNQGCSMNNVEMSTFSSLKQVRYWELELDQDSVSEIVVEFKRNKPGEKKNVNV